MEDQSYPTYNYSQFQSVQQPAEKAKNFNEHQFCIYKEQLYPSPSERSSYHKLLAVLCCYHPSDVFMPYPIWTGLRHQVQMGCVLLSYNNLPILYQLL